METVKEIVRIDKEKCNSCGLREGKRRKSA
jgi:hypothetical protein